MLKELGELQSLESALSAASSGFVITDLNRPDNPIVYANPAFSVMTGYTESEIVGRNCRFLQGRETDTATVDHLRACIRSGEEFESELLNYRKNGTPFYNCLFVSPIRDENEVVQGFVGVQQDVTRRHLAEQERERLIADLDEFSSIVAHDLQAPLRHIKAYLDIIKADHGELIQGEVEEYFEVVIGGAERASRMVQDTLKIARAGRAGADTELVELDKVVADVLDDLSADIASAGAKISVPSLPRVRGHASELYRIFANLLSNALRYRAPDRPCVITIECEASVGKWCLSVRDNGIGVPEESYDSVFRAFRRGVNVRHSEGSGIGLAVVKRILESHGGRIGLRSEVGVGTAFEFELPMTDIDGPIDALAAAQEGTRG